MPVENGSGLAYPLSHTIWYINKRATNANSHVNDLNSLYQAQPEGQTTWVPTTEDDTATRLLISRVKQFDHIELVVGGGDGTLHHAIHTLLSGLTPEALAKKEITVSVVGLGNKNDVAHMLHGEKFANVQAILQGTNVRPFTPLIIEKQIVTSNGPIWQHNDTAVYAFGAGATAKGAEIANEGRYRANNMRNPDSAAGKLRQKIAKAIADTKLVWSALSTKIEIQQEQGSAETITDITVANGGIMAGLLLLPSRLRKPGFFVSVTPDTFWGKVGSMFDRYCGQGASGRMAENNGTYQFQIAHPTLIHVDGEHKMLEPGTYRIRESEVALRLRAANTERPQHTKTGDFLAALGEMTIKIALLPMRNKH